MDFGDGPCVHFSPGAVTQNPDVQVTLQQWVHGKNSSFESMLLSGLQHLGGTWTFPSAQGLHLGWAGTSPREGLDQTCPACGQRGLWWCTHMRAHQHAHVCTHARRHHPATEPRGGTGWSGQALEAQLSRALSLVQLSMVDVGLSPCQGGVAPKS